ncbi:MAG TPA: O-antigen ligase family protein [Chitinophagales bacterium]|nr:O-antigen ligase family protein [Chitinophagales bacterium]HMZ68960.1 O-antigen ligase family protein [Chitinophagales bacterium]HNB38523.1 O-antigen ligase family protein [Chitinophagales bacterium]HNG08703.1 O-antigen ligase family protein [Chitinophagales bacterium]HNG26840.1 O-antigen ligase family protein [Chitinophagales bacterium]
MKTSIVKTLYLLVFYLGTALFINQFNKIKKLIWVLWIPTFLTIVYALIIHSSYNFSFESINKALHPIYRNHVNYGVFITMLFPFLIFLNRQSKAQTIPKLFTQISIPITLVAIYFTYTRGAWLGLLSMPIYYIVLKLKWTKSILIIVSITILSFGSYLFYNNNYQKFAPNFNKTIYHDKLSAHLNSTFEMEDMSTVERFYRWLASIKMSKKNLIYGVGPGNFTENYKPYTVASYRTYISENEEKSTVHNYFLLMLAEQGLVGLLIYVAFVFYLFIYIEKLYHKQIKKEHKVAVLLIACSILAFLFNNTLSDFLETNKVGSLFWINIGLLTIFSNPIKENEH